jgi:RHS repeat-associated protein
MYVTIQQPARRGRDLGVFEYVRYKPYGEVRGRYDGNGSPVDYCASGAYCREFTGYDSEPFSDLAYAGARVYDPALGMFLTEDPAHQGVNPYAYANWNPVMFTDPTGMGALWGLSGGFTSLGYNGFDSGKFAGAAATAITGNAGVGALFGGPAAGMGGGPMGAAVGAAMATALGLVALAAATPFALAGLGLAAAGALTGAVGAAPGALVGGVMGAFAGAAIGGLGTHSFQGALGGAFAGAGIGALAGMFVPEGAAIIGLGIAAGASSAMVTAVSEIAAGQAINPGAVAASFMLGVTTGWMGIGAAVASGSPLAPLIGGGVTAGLDAFYAAIGNAAQPAVSGGPQITRFANAGVSIYVYNSGTYAVVTQNGTVLYSGPNPP